MRGGEGAYQNQIVVVLYFIDRKAHDAETAIIIYNITVDDKNVWMVWWIMDKKGGLICFFLLELNRQPDNKMTDKLWIFVDKFNKY